MLRSIHRGHCLGTACILLSAAALLRCPAETLSTKTLDLSLENGRIVRMTNKLTGETMASEPDKGTFSLLWHRRPLHAPLEGMAAQQTASSACQWTFETDNQTSGWTSFTPDAGTGDVAVHQGGRSSRPGLYGTVWGLNSVPDSTTTLIIPGHSGIALGESTASTDLHLSWPTSWEAGMVLLQMEKGGFLIWARDPKLRFKALGVNHSHGKINVQFQSHNHAPFDGSGETTSVEWVITPYKGDWRVGAEHYRCWLKTQRPLVPLERQRPAWVKDIRFMAITGLNTERIAELARKVDPTRSVLYVPNWRKDRYDVNYPDYTASEQLGPFMVAAHALGFRVMLHVNYFGCDEKHALYERFKAYHLRSPHSDSLQWWIPPRQREKAGTPTIKFAYIHPGCAAWRALLVERFRELTETYGVDSLHLDQTLCIPNHNRGRVDGLTVPEGNLLMHRELREAMPAVALSGEGLNEVTTPYEAFAQRHAPRAVDHSHGSWNEAAVGYGHPVSSYLFLPQTVINGYLGLTNPANEGLYRAWKRSYENWGVIPTYARPSTAQLEAPSDEVRLLLEEAVLWTEHRLLPDFTGDWGSQTKFRWRGDDGVRVTMVAGPGNGSHCLLTGRNGRARELYRYVQGATRHESKADIQGWVAFDDDTILGLHPERTYLCSQRPRDPNVPHLATIPEQAVVQTARRNETRLVVELRDFAAERFFDLVEEVRSATCTVRTEAGETALERGGKFETGENVCGGIRRRSIFAHPPWHARQDVPGGVLGQTVAAYVVDLPRDRAAKLSFGIGLRDGVNERSDGATFIVRVNDQEVFNAHWAESAWSEHEIDLKHVVGERIKLELVTTPGPEDSPAFDWAIWGEPTVSLTDSGIAQGVDFVSPEPVTAVVADGMCRMDQPSLEADGMHRYTLEARVPGTVAFLWDRPVDVAYPIDLAKTPRTLSATVAGAPVALPMKHVATGPGSGTSEGETRSGLAAHPPNDGRVVADFFMRLPAASRITLSFAVALQDGSESDGCRFMVQANGVDVFNQLLTGPDGWHPGTVDLSRHAGRPVLLSLIVDSEGQYNFDWARWGQPIIRAE